MTASSVAEARIELLASHLHLAPELARCLHAEWSHLVPEWDEGDFLAAVKSRANTDRLPMSWVCTGPQGELVGTVTLKASDLKSHAHLGGPWLAALYVLPEYRGRGYGRRLVQAVEEKVRALGKDQYFLYTEEATDFYLALGWEVLERASKNGHPVAIMRRSLA